MILVDKIIYLLLLTLPLLLLTGPFLPDLAISIAGLFFLISIIYLKSDFKNYNKSIIIIFLFFFIYLIINSILSKYYLHSLSSSLFYFRFFIFSLAICYIYYKYENFKNYLFIILLIIFFIILLDSILQYILGYNIIGFEYNKLKSNERLSSFFGEEKILGSYITKLFPAFMFLLIYNTIISRRLKLFIFYFFSLSSLLLVIFSGERTALISLIAIICFIILFVKWERKSRIFFILFFIFTLISMFFNNNQFRERITLTLDNNHGMISDKGIRIFSPTHQSYVYSSIKMFQENKIFGLGPKNFRKYCDYELYRISYLEKLVFSDIVEQIQIDSGDIYEMYDRELLNSNASCSTHPHNMHVQLLAEIGLIGYLPLFIFIIFILKNLLINFKKLDDGYRIFLFSNLWKL